MMTLKSEIEEILLEFAKRVESLQRGDTYGWKVETQQLLALFDRHTKRAVVKAKIEAASVCRDLASRHLDTAQLSRMGEYQSKLKRELELPS